MYRLRFYPVSLSLICFFWLASFSGCGVVPKCITGKDCPVKYACQDGTCLAQTDPCAATGGTSCGSACVDLRTNNDHCGVCNQKCGSGAGCQNGQCVVAPKPVCTFGQDQTCNHRIEMSALAGTCLNDGTCQCNANYIKNQSSGKCDIACKASTEICNGLDDDCDGVIDNGCQCPVDTVRCGDACVSLATDVNHCGACGRKCPSGKSCENGFCFECLTGGTVCDGACVFLREDLHHCGACGNSCKNGYICRNSACICGVGRTLCVDACVDTSTDNKHCGTCGNACGIGTDCQKGQCKPVVPPPCTSDTDCKSGQVCLNGQCLGNKVDILFVIDNSGSMKEEQDRLLANISAFFAKLQQSKIDFQVAVLTTDMDAVFNPARGRFVQADPSTPKIVSSNLPSAQIEAAFRKNARVGTTGSNFERPLEAIQFALSPSSAGGFVDTDNKGFLRSDAALAIFILSDEDDCSHEEMLDEYRTPDTCYIPASVTLTDDKGNPLIGPNGKPEKGQMDKLTLVSKHTQFLKSLNRKIILSGLIGNPFIYKPGTQTPIDPPTGCTQNNQCGSQGAQCRYQTNSPVTRKCGGCQSTDTHAIAGFRLFEAVSQIHPNNPEQYVFPICGDATAYSFALNEFANKIAQINSPSPACTQNSDCRSGQVCLNGQCK